MGISSYTCSACSSRRCARVEGTAPYSKQDAQTRPSERCAPTCKGGQFCFERTTVFLPTRLISAAASAKVPMTLPAHIFCEYDGYHHHPVEEGPCAPGAAPAPRASKRSRGEQEPKPGGDGGGGAAAAAAAAPSAALQSDLELHGTSLTSGAFLVPSSNLVLVAENALSISSPEMADREREERFRKAYLVLGNVYCRSCWEKMPATAAAAAVGSGGGCLITLPLTPLVKSARTLAFEAAQLREDQCSWRMGRLAKGGYGYETISAYIPAWEATETPAQAACRALNARVIAGLEKDGEEEEEGEEGGGKGSKRLNGPSGSSSSASSSTGRALFVASVQELCTPAFADSGGLLIDYAFIAFLRYKYKNDSASDRSVLEALLAALRHPNCRIKCKTEFFRAAEEEAASSSSSSSSSAAAASHPPPGAPLCPTTFLRPLLPEDVTATLCSWLEAACGRQADTAVRALLAAAPPAALKFKLDACTAEALKPSQTSEKPFPTSSLAVLRQLVEVGGVDPFATPVAPAPSCSGGFPARPLKPLPSPATAAAKAGHVDFLKWLVESGRLAAAAGGSDALPSSLLLASLLALQEPSASLLVAAGARLASPLQGRQVLGTLVRDKAGFWGGRPLLALVRVLRERLGVEVRGECVCLSASEHAAEAWAGAPAVAAVPGWRGLLWVLAAGDTAPMPLVKYLLDAGCDANGALQVEGEGEGKGEGGGGGAGASASPAPVPAPVPAAGRKRAGAAGAAAASAAAAAAAAAARPLPSKTDTPLARVLANQEMSVSERKKLAQCLIEAGALLENTEAGQKKVWKDLQKEEERGEGRGCCIA
jgi:hypothetical protein